MQEARLERTHRRRRPRRSHLAIGILGAGLLGVLGGLLLGCSEPPAPPARNFVLVSLDTTRRDHLPTYGYGRDTAPALDGLARSGTVFRNAVAQWTTTLPSHTTMFTGLFPHTHGVGTNTRALEPSFTTLAEVLRSSGFRTGAFVSGYPLRLAQESLNQGFEVWDAKFGKMRRDGLKTTRHALRWLRDLKPDERFFLFLHLYDAHGPYSPDDEHLALFHSADPGPVLEHIPSYQSRRYPDGTVIRNLNRYIDRYDAQLRYQDDCLAKLLRRLDLSTTAVLVTADHGETLDERTYVLDHGEMLFDEQIRIPLVVHAPSLAAGSVTETVEQVDYLPTALELLGVKLPEGVEIQGESLVPLMNKARREDVSKLAFSSVRAVPKYYEERGYDLDRQQTLKTARSTSWKLIVYPGHDQEWAELYDLRQDPLEQHNLADQEIDVRNRLRLAIDAWHRDEAPPAPEVELSEEDRERLEALGYLGD